MVIVISLHYSTSIYYSIVTKSIFEDCFNILTMTRLVVRLRMWKGVDESLEIVINGIWLEFLLIIQQHVISDPFS
jgi:hypothetical protein